MQPRVLILSQQAELCAALASALLPRGYLIELASSSTMAGQPIYKGQFEAAVVAPTSFAKSDVAFLRELHGVVGNLIVLVEDLHAARQHLASFSGILVVSLWPLESERIAAFLEGVRAGKAAILQASGALGVVHFAGCTLDAPGHVFLNAARQEVALSRREFSLLVALASNRGRVLSRVRLRDAIDGKTVDRYDRSIDMLIARLRRKIEINPAHPEVIITVPGAGYKFVASVTN
jgi:DNA-binding response OmpR family regulator